MYADDTSQDVSGKSVDVVENKLHSGLKKYFGMDG